MSKPLKVDTAKPPSGTGNGGHGQNMGVGQDHLLIIKFLGAFALSGLIGLMLVLFLAVSKEISPTAASLAMGVSGLVGVAIGNLGSMRNKDPHGDTPQPIVNAPGERLEVTTTDEPKIGD